jgi:hypothetical protein
MNTTIKIIRKFNNLLEALVESGMDISYNAELAKKHAVSDGKDAEQVMLCDDGNIRYTMTCRDGFKIMNVFSPFMSCLDNNPFRKVTINEDSIEIGVERYAKKNRKELIKLGWLFT